MKLFGQFMLGFLVVIILTIVGFGVNSNFKHILFYNGILK
jgi:hypothetical protein